jgi:hypothetical protein
MLADGLGTVGQPTVDLTAVSDAGRGSETARSGAGQDFGEVGFESASGAVRQDGIVWQG